MWDESGRRKAEQGTQRIDNNGAPPSGWTASLKQTLHFPVKFRDRSIQGFAAGVDDDRPLWAQPVQLEANRLADAAFDAIAHHGFAEGARQGEADPRSEGRRIAHAKRGEEGAGEADTLVVNPAEIL